MVFSSVTFLFFFLPLALTATFFPGNRRRKATLLLLSLLFYVWGEREHPGGLVVSILVNALLGLGLGQFERDDLSEASASSGGPREAKTRRVREAILATGIAFNVGLLIFYKYSHFLLENLHPLLQGLGVGPIVLGPANAPLGISFFTFHALSYLIDVYRREGKSLRNPLDLAFYLAFFPKILAGPILPYREAGKEPGAGRPTTDGFASGIERFIIGMGKKILLANPLAAVADKVFGVPGAELGFEVAWLGILCFTLQIYFDFSGYTDMAIGLGRMFGVELPENFNFPYVAQSVQEFWRRWHISLSNWLRNYLYIPLGGNRCSRRKQFFNLLTVFLVCGLWHGASWNFIVWGLWYGLFLILERTGFGARLKSAPKPVRHLYALAVIVIGWVFFRSETLSYALFYLKAMAGFGSATGGAVDLPLLLDSEVILCLFAGIVGSFPLSTWIKRFAGPPLPNAGAHTGALSLHLSSVYMAFLGLLFLLSCMSLAGVTHKAFIYFKF